MAGNDWNNLGKDLNRIIDDAVHMGNYGRLNDSINTVLKKAFGSVDPEGTHKGSSSWDFNLSRDGSYTGNNGLGNRPSHNFAQNKTYRESPFKSSTYNIVQSPYFVGSGKRKGGSVGMLIGGIILTSVSGIGILISLISLLIVMGNVGLSISGVGAVALIVGIVLIVNGRRGLKLAKRFDRYVELLKGKTYGDVKMLASYIHKPESDVVKDLKKMMNKGWFLQGHLDEKETCLMVSHETYEQYMNTVKNNRLQKEEEKRRKAEDAKKVGLTPEAKAVIDEGHTYIDKIKESNDAIPGEEISNKIFKMELLVRRIFEQAEVHPESINEMRKLMEYYLPMTVKLLGAYEELDKQPVQGDNITGAKKEIEDTLDTLNVAFEKLLDNLFRDTAWDVSSDISVLQTMLAQEGLTKDDFSK